MRHSSKYKAKVLTVTTLAVMAAVLSTATASFGANYGNSEAKINNREVAIERAPVTLPFEQNLTPIAAGEEHTCAIVNGGAKCWGSNSHGRLGNGTTTNSLVPVDVSGLGLGSGVTAIAAGVDHTCAIVSGAAKCWGRNYAGQLGNGTTATSSLPVQVLGLDSGVTAIAAGYGHTCAIVSGVAKCWGSNSSGQLGNDSTTASRVPVDVLNLGSGVTAIAAGAGYTCAIVSSGAAKCWGSNGDGELGNGDNTTSRVPVQVLGLSSGVTAIAAGFYHTCAIVSGAAKCWGYNADGQLGDDTTLDRLEPVSVLYLT
ncbi:MAG: hypothetical protein RL119_782 [Actinomycetota bacterium]